MLKASISHYFTRYVELLETIILCTSQLQVFLAEKVYGYLTQNYFGNQFSSKFHIQLLKHGFVHGVLVARHEYQGIR